jgi:hypothetical protein
MQLIANPPSNLASVLLNMQFASSAVATVCRYDGYDPTTLPLRQQGRQTVGYRFVLGLVSLSAAERYNLRTAALQTGGADAGTFVAPGTASMREAAELLAADDETHAWTLDYEALGTRAGAAAYPGAMPIYAVVPTVGLPEEEVDKFVKLLCYASGAGQVPGRANGELPAGFLPVTAENGLGAQHDYTLAAVAAVRAQDSSTPALDAEAPAADEVCDFSEKPTKPTATPTDDGNGGGTGVAAPPVSGPVPGGGKPGGKGAAPSEAPVTEATTVLTSGQSSAFGQLGVPSLLVIAVACAVAGSLIRWWDPIEKGAAAAGPKAKALLRRGRTP